MNKIVIAVIGIVALLIAGLLVLVVSFDEEAAGTAIVAGLEQASGRQFEGERRASLALGLNPVVSIAALTSSNTVAGTRRAEFVVIEGLALETTWSALFRRAPEFLAIRVDRIVLNLETTEDGAPMWLDQTVATGAPSGSVGAAMRPVIDGVAVKHLLVRYYSGWAQAEREYAFADIAIDLRPRDADGPITLSFNTNFLDGPVEVSGTASSRQAVFMNKPFELDLLGQYLGRESTAEITLGGSVAALAGLKGLDLRFKMVADSLNDVGSISGFALPRDTPIKISASLSNQGNGPQLDDYVLRIGQAIIRPQAASAPR